MDLSVNEISPGNKKLSAMKAPLNPNAAEFVPLSLRSSSTSVRNANASSKFASSTAASHGKAVLDRSESSASNNSDDEDHQFWRCQLPDDITPDFNFMGTGDTQVINDLSLSSLSLSDVGEGSRVVSSGFISNDQGLAPHVINGNQNGEQLRRSRSSFGEYPTFQPSVGKPWDRQVIGDDYFLAGGHHSYTDDSQNSFPLDMPNEPLLEENAAASPLKFLASQFPGFAVESLAEVFFANGGDLNLTIDMLSQLELQVDGGMKHSFESKTLAAPTLTALDFPALTSNDGQNGDQHLNINPHHASGKHNSLFFRSNPSIPPSGATDFASAVRKMAPRDAGIWNYARNGSSDTNIGSSRSSQNMGSSYDGGFGKASHIDRLSRRGSAHASPAWLETGAAVANMYSEMREEARDHARVRNAYFEQARQAYLNGNKALAKDLSIKGQMHNMQMKAAHVKAQESIYRQRNPEMHSSGQERLIDLHGLHASEAIHVLKRELAVMRNAARVTDRRLLVDICVGTGHHTRGSRTLARLPIAVQRYLLEEEGLVFSEPQPGLLRVVV